MLQPNQMDDDHFIEAFEKSPAFNRDKKVADEIKSIGRASATPTAESNSQHTDNKPAGNPGSMQIHF